MFKPMSSKTTQHGVVCAAASIAVPAHGAVIAGPAIVRFRASVPGAAAWSPSRC